MAPASQRRPRPTSRTPDSRQTIHPNSTITTRTDRPSRTRPVRSTETGLDRVPPTDQTVANSLAKPGRSPSSRSAVCTDCPTFELTNTTGGLVSFRPSSTDSTARGAISQLTAIASERSTGVRQPASLQRSPTRPEGTHRAASRKQRSSSISEPYRNRSTNERPAWTKQTARIATAVQRTTPRKLLQNVIDWRPSPYNDAGQTAPWHLQRNGHAGA